MTTTLTLTDFLLARIAEEEAAAQYSTSMWTSVPSTARVLAECEAKRRIVEKCGMEVRQQELNPRRTFYDTSERYVLYALASVYADHPDYRDEWRP